jgi:hypothetical protein
MKIDDERLSQLKSAISQIREKHKIPIKWGVQSNDKTKSAAGTIICPRCKGTLNYSVSGHNGHIWGKCDTDNCLGWMM